MTRNTPEILPYCQHCGDFKGVGPCKNPECDKTNQVDIRAINVQSSRCPICSNDGEHVCTRCGHAYCKKHAIMKDESSLKSIDQHLGTCVVCGKVVCEHCWILNNKGSVTCLVHLETTNHD